MASASLVLMVGCGGGGSESGDQASDETASGSGNATWKWIVPANTTPGTYPVTVTCQSGGHSAKATKQMTITG